MKVTLPLQEDTAHEALPAPGGPILWHAGALAELASRLSGHEQLVHRSSRRASRDGTRPLQERSQVAPPERNCLCAFVVPHAFSAVNRTFGPSRGFRDCMLQVGRIRGGRSRDSGAFVAVVSS